MKDLRLSNCPECGSAYGVDILNNSWVCLKCRRCGHTEYAPTEAEVIEKWNFLAKLKSEMQSGEITVDEAEHEYHDRYLKD